MKHTRFTRWLQRKTEKFFSRFYEGPEPPDRLRQIAIEFSNLYPNATRAQWVVFATGHAGEAYRMAYLRGYEHAERDDEVLDVTPEELADVSLPGWREEPYDWDWRPDAVLDGDGTDVVTEEDPIEAQLQRALNNGRSQI